MDDDNPDWVNRYVSRFPAVKCFQTGLLEKERGSRCGNSETVGMDIPRVSIETNGIKGEDSQLTYNLINFNYEHLIRISNCY